MLKSAKNTIVKHNRSMVLVDWGTSRLRLWHVSDSGEVLGRTAGPFGMSGLERSDYAGVLEQQISTLSVPVGSRVLICGMAGAAQGWQEAPYMSTTDTLLSLGQHAVRVLESDDDVRILPGVMQQEPCNVMRGEETQILGLLATQPQFNGVVCLPGTHTKWVRVDKGSIKRFTTCMTGELFALIADQSVLKHSIAETGWDDAAFSQSVIDTSSEPASIAESLFSLRAAMLLKNYPGDSARASLSGMLIGLELAATQSYWQSNNLVIVGEPLLCQAYSKALTTQNIQSAYEDAEAMTLAGLIAASKQIEDYQDGA